jgi:hypothetical protein
LPVLFRKLEACATATVRILRQAAPALSRNILVVADRSLQFSFTKSGMDFFSMADTK